MNQQLHEAFHRRPPVGCLGSMLLADNAKNSFTVDTSGKASFDQFLVCLRQTGRVLQVKQQCHPSVQLVDILTPRSTAAGSLELEFFLWNEERVADLDHGSLPRHAPSLSIDLLNVA